MEHLLTPLREAQHPAVGGGGGKIFLRKTEAGAHDHPIQPGAGVALGFDSSEDVLQRILPAAFVHELPPQPLGAVGEGFEFPVRHGAKLREHRPLAPFQGVDGRTVKQIRGHIGAEAFAAFDQRPEGGGGGVLGVGLDVVVAARPMDGGGAHGRVLGEDGLAVFHSQNVVGRAD